MSSAALVGVVTAAAFAVFVMARFVAGMACRIPGRLPPFGEAPAGAFDRAGRGARLAVTLAGPAATYALLAGLCTVGWLLQSRPDDHGAVLLHVLAGSPAERAGLAAADRVLSVGPTRVARGPELRLALLSQPDGPVTLVVNRGGETMRVVVTPYADHAIGVKVADPPRVRDALRRGPLMPPGEIAMAAGALVGARASLAGPVAVVSAATPPRDRVGQALVQGASALALQIFPALLLGALLLWPPRRRGPIMDPAAAPAVAPSSEAPPSSAPRPWRRLAARLVDGTLVGAPLVWLTAGNEPAAGLGGALLVLVFVPLEAALMAAAGYTPGKWLLRIAVRDGQGRPPGFRIGVRRAALVRIYGLAASSVFGVATALLARHRLLRTGATYWDALDGWRVEHGALSTWRAIVAGAILLGGAAAVVLALAR